MSIIGTLSPLFQSSVYAQGYMLIYVKEYNNNQAMLWCTSDTAFPQGNRLQSFSGIKATATALATETMIKSKPNIAATGENPIVVCAKEADIIIGPIGIVIADSLYGEITARSALAVSKSKAVKLLIPINKCNNIVVGITDNFIKDALSQIINYIDNSLQ